MIGFWAARLRKLSLCLLCLTTLAGGLFCREKSAEKSSKFPVNFFSTENPEYVFSAGFGLPYTKDLRMEENPAEFKFSTDFTELYADSGVCFTGNKFDFATHAKYMPTFFDWFRAGFGFTWHYYKYSDIFYENDLIFTHNFTWCKGPVFSFDFEIGFLLKWAVIESVKAFKPYIFTDTYVLGFGFNWKVFDWLKFYLSVKSVDFFDYPNIGTPYFKFGADFRFLQNFGASIDFTLKYVDMFASAVYLSESVTRVSFKVVF